MSHTEAPVNRFASSATDLKEKIGPVSQAFMTIEGAHEFLGRFSSFVDSVLGSQPHDNGVAVAPVPPPSLVRLEQEAIGLIDHVRDADRQLARLEAALKP